MPGQQSVGYGTLIPASSHATDDRAQVVGVPDMAHELADEPGIEPTPQTPHAAVVDRRAVEWFERHLADSR